MATHVYDREEPASGADARRSSAEARSGAHATQQVEAMVAAWQRGERPLAEKFLASLAESGDEAAIRLIYEEVCLRQEAGLEVDPAEILGRFPRWQAELEVLLDCHRLFQMHPAPPAFPEVGEVLGGFRLLVELGRGAAGRVYLASQPSLADRPVVLKVTARGREEHLSLARLQHMNVMPLYSEQVLLARNLQILCMPYLGGATLSRIFETLAEKPPARRSGKDLIEAMDRAQAELPVFLPAQGPFRKMLSRANYIQALCWIGACLADGLQYAHDRGLVHMDIKPSNVLLTGEGQPMLLDFHLARGPIGPDGPLPSWLGGTPEYVSPEQQAAMAALREGRAVVVTVDGRSDVYSLGVLLDEALGGPVAGPCPSGASRTPLHRRNPDVSVGLSDIIRKCLRPDPADRYPDASSLATDLRRHLNHLPLLGVPNRSLLERWRKWRRRRPSALPRKLVLAVSVATLISASAFVSNAYRQRVQEIESALEAGRESLARQQFAEAARSLSNALKLAGPTPAVGKLRRALTEELLLVQRDWKAAELHRLADLIRFRYGLAPQPSEEARSIVRRGPEIWEARGLLTAPIGDRREPEIEGRIRTDLLDFVTVWADLLVRLAPPGETVAARREALHRLDEADALLGPSPALDRVRRENAEALGLAVPTPAATSPPRSAWEHCDLGRSYLRSGDLEGAAEEFARAVDLRPQDFWPNFYLGVCAYRLGRHDEAVTQFSICNALAPDTAECYVNRALAYEALGQPSSALRDYTRALQIDRTLSAASLGRGALYIAQGQLAEAAADLDQALVTATGPEALGAIHYQRALLSLARGDRPSALSNLETALKYGHEEARSLFKKLQP